MVITISALYNTVNPSSE